MSNRRPKRRRQANAIDDLLGPLDGAHIPGGCDQCDAYQTVRTIEGGAYAITVHHDDWCPRWKRRRKQRP